MIEKFKKLISVLSTPSYRRTFIHTRVAASTENDILLQNLEPRGIKTFIDVGSNRGQFALAARQHFPGAMIHCFEPLEKPVQTLRKVFQHDQQVNINAVAVGAKPGQNTMHVSLRDDSSSILPISDLQSTIFPGTGEKETIPVTIQPLEAILSSSEIEQPSFLKIDVQGYEAEVLAGCISVLPMISLVYVECSFVPLYTGQALASEIITFLQSHGFSLSGIYNLCYDRSGNSIQGDFLFSKNTNQ